MAVRIVSARCTSPQFSILRSSFRLMPGFVRLLPLEQTRPFSTETGRNDLLSLLFAPARHPHPEEVFLVLARAQFFFDDVPPPSNPIAHTDLCFALHPPEGFFSPRLKLAFEGQLRFCPSLVSTPPPGAFPARTIGLCLRPHG